MPGSLSAARVALIVVQRQQQGLSGDGCTQFDQRLNAGKSDFRFGTFQQASDGLGSPGHLQPTRQLGRFGGDTGIVIPNHRGHQFRVRRRETIERGHKLLFRVTLQNQRNRFHQR